MQRFFLLLALVLSTANAEAADYYWSFFWNQSVHFPSLQAACQSEVSSVTELVSISPGVPNAFTGTCHMRRISDGYLSTIVADRYGATCPVHYLYNSQTGACDIPDPANCPPGMVSANGGTTCAPPPVCPEGGYWDFDSESCKYPQDDMCPVGSNWDPEKQDCICDGPGVLSNANGLRFCFPPAENECTKDSPDFMGYMNNQPICQGRARCPSGFKPGYVGKGDQMEAVCVPDFGTDDPDCDGTKGNFNGKELCVPDFGDDPACPTGKGGTVNGEHVCQEDPLNDPRCKPGEVSGYVGRGEEMNHTCVPSDYKPETCPPGQYSWNMESGGFACVYAKPSPDEEPCVDDPETPTNECQQKIGGNTVTKDAEGNVTGSQESELSLPEDGLEVKINGLLQDQPNINYAQQMKDHGESELNKLDENKVLRDFRDADGMFTSRSKLEDAGDELLGLFGYSTSCSGSLLFYTTNTGYRIEATCDKLEKMKRIFGWILYVVTAMGIWNVLMQKQES